MDMRRLLGLYFVWEFGRGFVLDVRWTCLATVMIAPNAEVGKSVGTSFAQLLSSGTNRGSSIATSAWYGPWYRGDARNDCTAGSRFLKCKTAPVRGYIGGRTSKWVSN
jgi:hypothetical protein